MDLLQFLKEYWAIIIAIITFVTSYADLKSQNKQQERRIAKLEKNDEELNPVLLEIRTKLASIEATLQMMTRK